ncbi:hypothetical protein GWN42_30175 [candidate division KSB1 bacterium]|nr:hypothetical protein [candidate division KSB1 bacterium]NIS27541.1 hypothetical protein [candidate division KSB1 bacterium]NIU28259.1 hypothetical protein [candidate division KSB1 bacterium]NIU91144.1 hypothetical protein [candidate division KSB1 bacterium]NIV96940.1 hypothetical protein [candidate division KSB1 bacterium]
MVAVQENQIRWMNDVGSKMLDLPEGYLNTAFSKVGHYFGVIHLIEPPKKNNRNKILQIDIYTSSGEKRYSLNRNQYYDDSIPSIVISNLDGSVIMGKNSVGKLWFYREDGELSKQVELFPDASYDLERILHLDLSEDGARLAVVASKRGASHLGSEAPHPSGEPHLFLFTHNGDELWRKALPDFNSSATAISKNGDHIIANSYTVDTQGNLQKQSLLFNDNGERIASFDLLFKYAHFSPDSRFLILAENTKAHVVELSTGRTVWSDNVSRKQGMITAVRLANNADVAVLLIAKNEFREGGFVFTNSRLRVLDRSGALHQDIAIKDEIFRKPALKLSPDHRHITVGFENSYRIYEANK